MARSPFVIPGLSRATGALVLGAAVLAGAAGCGGGSIEAVEPSTTTTIATTTTTAPPVLTKGQLTDAALTTTDLPPGWAIDTSSSSSDGGGGGGVSGGADSFLCAKAKTPAGGGTSADARFQQSTNGPFIMQSLGSAKDSEDKYDEAVDAFAACIGEQWSSDFGGTEMAMTIADTSGPQVGDETRSFRITGSAQVAPVEVLIDFVFVRRATAMQLYGLINVQSPVLSINQVTGEQFAEIVRTGDEKVKAAFGGKPA